MKLWRIAAETRKYAAHDLSGGGAAASPGRWNDDKQAVIYSAPTIAIAVLETAACPRRSKSEPLGVRTISWTTWR